MSVQMIMFSKRIFLFCFVIHMTYHKCGGTTQDSLKNGVLELQKELEKLMNENLGFERLQVCYIT